MPLEAANLPFLIREVLDQPFSQGIPRLVVLQQSSCKIMKRVTARADIMPYLPVVFGLAEVEAAAAIGVSASKFRALVQDGRMPPARRIDGRLIWDVDELRAAFKALPHEKESEPADSWADVV